jgi:Lon protease-like protein
MRRMRLPFFPLHAVTFPHLPLPLHVFEPRYRAMARDLMSEHSGFGGRFVTGLIVEGREAGGPYGRTGSVGTLCEVRTAEQLPDGRWVLLAVGVARATLGAVDETGEYAIVEAEPMEDVDGATEPTLLPAVQAALDAYMETVKRFVTATASVGHESHEVSGVAASLDDVLKPIQLPSDPSAASYAVGGLLQIELTRKQQLLELPDAASRLRAELDLLRRESQLLAESSLPPVPTSDLGYHPN